MGLSPSGGSCSRVLELIFDQMFQQMKCERIIFADNLNVTHRDVDTLIDTFGKILELCVIHNLLIKPNELQIAFPTTSDTEFHILGFSFRNSRIFPPPRKITNFVNTKLPRSRKVIESLVMSLSYYRCLSPRFAFYHQALKNEIERQKSASSKFTLTPVMIKYL